MVSAGRALAMGVLNAVTAPGDLLEAAHDDARRIAVNAPLAVAATKQSVLEGLALRVEEAHRNEARLSDLVRASDDANEGVTAWAEKRTPVWRGR
jgi:enoyl-CoA hydratase